MTWVALDVWSKTKGVKMSDLKVGLFVLSLATLVFGGLFVCVFYLLLKGYLNWKQKRQNAKGLQDLINYTRALNECKRNPKSIF
jgi:hypothetical protein